MAWRLYLAVGGDAEALGQAGVRRQADVAAAEDIAASQVLPIIEEEVAEGVRELAVNLICAGGRELPHDGVDELIAVGLVCRAAAKVLQEEPLHEGDYGGDKSNR